MDKNGRYRKIASYGAIAIALIAIAFYTLNPKQGPTTDPSLSKSEVTSISPENKTPSDTQKQDQQKQPIPDNTKSTSNNTADTSTSDPNSTLTSDNIAIKITKSEVISQAKFYPYNLDGTKMEIIAVKATDGTIRTALNTCQVCYDSGRGYYVQEGDYLVCQNCGNRFNVDQIEKIKGGCNPVPILETSKKDMGTYIAISKDFIATQKQYFENWKRS